MAFQRNNMLEIKNQIQKVVAIFMVAIWMLEIGDTLMGGPIRQRPEGLRFLKIATALFQSLFTLIIKLDLLAQILQVRRDAVPHQNAVLDLHPVPRLGRPLPASPLSVAYRHYQAVINKRRELDLEIPSELFCPVISELMTIPVYHPLCKQQAYDQSLLDDAATYNQGTMIRHPHLNQLLKIDGFKIHHALQQKIHLFLKVFGEYLEQPRFVSLSPAAQRAVYEMQILPRYLKHTTLPLFAELITEAKISSLFAARLRQEQKDEKTNEISDAKTAAVVYRHR